MKRRSKYGNRKTVVDGITFDSAAEARRYGELKLFEHAKKIGDLERQKVFVIEVENVKVCTYRADFFYYDYDELKWIVEDVKGARTREYLLKKKLMWAVYRVKIREIDA